MNGNNEWEQRLTTTNKSAGSEPLESYGTTSGDLGFRGDGFHDES